MKNASKSLKIQKKFLEIFWNMSNLNKKYLDFKKDI
jgi:hypothetical protein